MTLKKNFNLVELLVVISVISILFSLLSPALRSALSSSYRISCSQQLKQITIAVITYSDDFSSQIPATSDIYNSTGYYIDFIYEPFNRNPSGLGRLLYEDYLSDGLIFSCPEESEGVWFRSSSDRKVENRSSSTFKTLLDASQEPDFQSAYSYRGHLWAKANGGIPAHGPHIDEYTTYIRYIDKRPCSEASCGAYHSTLSLISDSFSFDAGVGPPLRWGKEAQGRFHHKEGYNVAYTDGHLEWISDPSKKIINLENDYPLSIGLFRSDNFTEDVWDAFDGDIGKVNGVVVPDDNFHRVYGLK